MKRIHSFPADSRSVAEARRFAARVLDGSPPDVIESVVLMVSELATNSIRHVHSAFSVVVERTSGQIRVEVSDRSEGVPSLRSPGPDELGGRGLLIVQMLSDRWGVAPHAATGKTVWFTVGAEASQSRDRHQDQRHGERSSHSWAVAPAPSRWAGPSFSRPESAAARACR